MKGKEVYNALTRNDSEKVRELCDNPGKGPFLKLTERRQSVLQKALYSTQVDLVLKLLEDAEKRCRADFERKLVMDVTTKEDTILHVAATHDDCIPAVRKILERTTQLLFYSNKKGETPIFNAVRYGQRKMFEFLNNEYIRIFPDEEDRLYRYRAVNKSSSKLRKHYNILHVAIYNEHFDLALYIATTIPSLVREKDYNNLTGLHMLAMNPSAFETRSWKYLEFLFPCPFPRLSKEILREEAKDDDLEKAKNNDLKKAMKKAKDEDLKKAADAEIFPRDARDSKWKVAAGKMTILWWKRKTDAYRRYQAAVLLGSFLVKRDTSWLDKLVIHDPNSDKDDDDDEEEEDEEDFDNDSDDEPKDYDDDDDDHNNEDVNTVGAPGGATQTNPAVSMVSKKPAEKPPTPDVSKKPEKPPTPDVSKKPEKPPTPLVLATKGAWRLLVIL